jgi:hypothetical protein
MQFAFLDVSYYSIFYILPGTLVVVQYKYCSVKEQEYWGLALSEFRNLHAKWYLSPFSKVRVPRSVPIKWHSYYCRTGVLFDGTVYAKNQYVTTYDSAT